MVHLMSYAKRLQKMRMKFAWSMCIDLILYCFRSIGIWLDSEEEGHKAVTYVAMLYSDYLLRESGNDRIGLSRVLLAIVTMWH